MRWLIALLVVPLVLLMACGSKGSGSKAPAAAKAPAATPAANTTPGAAAPAAPPVAPPPAQVNGTPIAAAQLPIVNSWASRDLLLAASTAGDWSKQGDQTDIKQYPAWSNAIPGLKLVAPDKNADAKDVSVYRNQLDPKNPASDTNPKVIAFAVMDSNGACAGGALKGFPSYNSFSSISFTDKPCQAQTVLDALKGLSAA